MLPVANAVKQLVIKRDNSPVICFTACRYVVYILIFFRGVLLAKFLGPYLFGIYGFISMMQWYLLSTGLGINYAINVELSTQDNLSNDKLSDIINTAIFMTIMIGIIVVILGAILHTFAIHIFDKYLFYKYALILGCITCANLIQQVLINVYRYYKKLFRIALVELFSAALLLSIALIYKDFELINAILIGLLVTGLISIAILLIHAPFKLSLQLNIREAKTLLSVGIPLLIFNVSFFMMTIVAQTIISAFYSVETMGYYTLANNITGAILLGINSITWIILPDILFRTREGLNNSEVSIFIEKITVMYSVTVFITVFIAIIMLPLLYLFLPQYQSTHPVIVILLLSQVVLSYCFGYNCLAVARRKQMLIATLSLLTVLIVAILSYTVVLLKISFVWIAVAVLIATQVYNILQTKAGINIISNSKYTHRNKISGLKYYDILIMIICIFGSLSRYSIAITVFSFAIYLLINKDKLVIAYNLYGEIIHLRDMQ